MIMVKHGYGKGAISLLIKILWQQNMLKMSENEDKICWKYQKIGKNHIHIPEPNTGHKFPQLWDHQSSVHTCMIWKHNIKHIICIL
jgi:hypothetical protein